MTRKEWLQQIVVVDEYGRPYNLSEMILLGAFVPMTHMKRSGAYKKQRFDKKKIDKLYREDMGDVETVKEEIYG